MDGRGGLPLPAVRGRRLSEDGAQFTPSSDDRPSGRICSSLFLLLTFLILLQLQKPIEFSDDASRFPPKVRPFERADFLANLTGDVVVTTRFHDSEGNREIVYFIHLGEDYLSATGAKSSRDGNERTLAVSLGSDNTTLLVSAAWRESEKEDLHQGSNTEADDGDKGYRSVFASTFPFFSIDDTSEGSPRCSAGCVMVLQRVTAAVCNTAGLTCNDDSSCTRILIGDDENTISRFGSTDIGSLLCFPSNRGSPTAFPVEQTRRPAFFEPLQGKLFVLHPPPSNVQSEVLEGSLCVSLITLSLREPLAPRVAVCEAIIPPPATASLSGESVLGKRHEILYDPELDSLTIASLATNKQLAENCLNIAIIAAITNATQRALLGNETRELCTFNTGWLIALPPSHLTLSTPSDQLHNVTLLLAELPFPGVLHAISASSSTFAADQDGEVDEQQGLDESSRLPPIGQGISVNRWDFKGVMVPRKFWTQSYSAPNHLLTSRTTSASPPIL